MPQPTTQMNPREADLKTAGPDPEKVPGPAELGRNPVLRGYKINVDEDGKFEYTPAGVDWEYGRGDRVIYVSDSGPFTIEFDLDTAGEPKSPWRSGKITLESSSFSPYVTEQQIVRIPNNPSDKNPKAKYNYKISVQRRDGNGVAKKFTNDPPQDKNGSVGC